MNGNDGVPMGPEFRPRTIESNHGNTKAINQYALTADMSALRSVISHIPDQPWRRRSHWSMGVRFGYHSVYTGGTTKTITWEGVQ